MGSCRCARIRVIPGCPAVDNARATATRAPAQTAAPIVLTGFIKLLLPKAIMNFHTNLALVMLTRSPFWRPGRLKLYTQLRSFSQDFLFGSWIRHTISQTPKSWSSRIVQCKMSMKPELIPMQHEHETGCGEMGMLRPDASEDAEIGRAH